MNPPAISPQDRLGTGLATRVVGLTWLALAPVLGILWLAAATERRQAMEDARQRLSREARTVALRISDSAGDVGSRLSALALVPEFRELSPSACELLRDVFGLDTTYVSLALVRPDGSFACQTLGGTGTSVADRLWFQIPMREGRPTTQVLRRGRISQVPVLVVGHPVFGSDGRPTGVLGAGLAIDDPIGGSVEASTLSGSGLRLLGDDGILTQSWEGPAEVDEAEAAFYDSADTLRVADLTEDGARYITALARIPTVNGLIVSLRADESSLLAPVQRRFRLQLAALALLAVVALLLSRALIGRWVVRPLVGVVGAAQRLGRGDLDARAPDAQGPREVRWLARTFNAMAASLEDRERVVRAANQALHESSERLAQAQKMEALGHLTGGVAHDFNNLLTVIGGNLQLALESGVRDPEGLVAQALRASESGAEVTRRLLAFARKQPLTATSSDLNGLCRGIQDLLARSLGEHIEIVYVLHPDPIPCTLDTSQMESVLLNLAVNARDAMPQGGVLTVRTARREIGGHERLRDGVYAVVEVSDTGSGMTQEVAARAFEPFFTTKERGQGTGLGLSGALGFAEQSGGTLELDTRPGMGTRVRVLVPAD